MLVVGEKEEQTSSVAVRSRDLGDLGQISRQDLISKLQKENDEKTIVKPEQ